MDALQYGALGLLGIVLTGLFALAKFWFQKIFTQNDEYFKFVRDQVNAANAERAGQLTAWIDAYKSQIRLLAQRASRFLTRVCPRAYGKG